MEILKDLNRTLFITKSGKKIHLRRNCLTIKDSYVIELKYDDIDKEKYCTICQKCVAKEKIFKSQIPFINKKLQNKILSISSIHANSNYNSSKELEPIPDDFSISLKSNLNHNNNNYYINNKNNYNNNNNNNNYNNYYNNKNNNNNNNNNTSNSDSNSNSNNIINNIQTFSNSSDENIINTDKNNFDNFKIINSSYQKENFIDSISKKEPSFINKSKSQNNDCLNIDQIGKIFIDNEDSTNLNTYNPNNLKYDLKEIKLDFKINNKLLTNNKTKYNFNQNYIFYFNIEVILKKNLCKIKTGFSIKYIDDNEEEDSFDTIKLIHDFTIKNNSKINYWINLKEGFFNLNIQNNKKTTKKKKCFEKINLLHIIQIKPYLKIDKENECEYYINDEKINL